MRTLTLQEVEDMLHGAAIYGTGGGGSLEEALQVVRTMYAAGKRVKLAGLDEIGDDWLIASPYYVGSVAPPDPEVVKRFAELPVTADEVPTTALRALQAYLGRPIQAVIATELGGNTACAMETAASQDIPLVDADPAGRAVPDLAHSTFHVHGVSIAPFALASRYGDTAVVTAVVNHAHAEMIARNFAILFGNTAGVCDHPVDGRRLKQSVIAGTLTQAERVGRAMRLANERGESPTEAILAAVEGSRSLIDGVIREADWQDVKGFTEGQVVIEPSDAEQGELPVTLWFRNEHMIARRGEQILSIIPELITVLDQKTGMPILNPDCTPGMEVTVVTFPAPAAWESDKGLSIFGPEYIGMSRQTYAAGKGR
ncbi:DUF917 domain-containing protein [Brevibacillus humidisoli]|uniref:DUF917 domain-containing protein n=1 Tax=Brevibacillus humidisoli TaxID=2895522 RepID=UPI001E3542D8|nr:DUF917 domain-containing protein [Brevibacillus humidisoli]UFJ40774.1 DUF917 domain-containing protein [Brevibacillus humidisoli]